MEEKLKDRTEINEFMKLESFMLPPQFRRRSAWRQRLRMIIVVISYATTMGLFAFTIIGGLKENFNVNTNQETTYFLIGIIMPAMLMFLFGGYISWSRSRTYITSVTGMIGLLIPPLLLAVGIVYMDIQKNEDIVKFLTLNGIITLVTGVATIIYVITRNFFKTRTYREAKFRTMYTTPGIMVASVGPYLLQFLTAGKKINDVGNTPLYVGLGAFAVGILLFAIGVALSTKYMLSPEKNIWSAIRFTSGLPAIVIYTMLVAISFKEAMQATIILPIVFEAVAEIGILIGFIAFLFFRGRIKNMNKTNPLYNEITLKLFIIAILMITLTSIFLLPSISRQKGYGEFSFAMLALGGIVVVIGIITAHFMNLITYNRYNKSVMGGIALATMVIYGIALTIASLQQASIIADIIGRQLALAFGIIALIFQLITLSINLSYVFTNSIRKSEKVIKKLKESKNKKGDK